MWLLIQAITGAATYVLMKCSFFSIHVINACMRIVYSIVRSSEFLTGAVLKNKFEYIHFKDEV